jgi:arylsulfatase
VLPIRRPPFAGVAGKTLGDSEPDWGLIGHVQPPAGAPKGLEIGGGVGLVVGLLAPPLLASAVVGGAAGALIGKFARHRVESGLEEKMGAALPPGSAGVVAIYDRGKASTVDATLASAVRKSVAHVDGSGAKKLKAALAEAQAGMGG